MAKTRFAGNEKADALAKQASASYFTGPEPSVSISVSTIYSSINEWTVHEQNRMWQELSGCRQAKYFLHGFVSSRAQYARRLSRKDLRILVGILTGHADFNWHLFIMGVSQVSKCPLCQEDEDTSLHFIAQCSALMLLRKNILGDYTISLDALSDIHWFLLLKSAKASKRFCRPWGLSGLRTGPMKWPQRWVAAFVVTLPAGKSKSKGKGRALHA